VEVIVQSFGLDSASFVIQPIGTGHIHKTYKLVGQRSYILQRVNKNVFKQPEIIASNLRLAADYLKKNFPAYSFLSAIPSIDHLEMVYDSEGYPWRLFEYRENTITVDKVNTPQEAFSAAREFARLTRYLDKIDVKQFKETIPGFQDLKWRFQQFETALSYSTRERRKSADHLIQDTYSFHPILKQYVQLIKEGSLRPRIVHNDTKINNILFDALSGEAVFVIDLDTLMPGYFIYDLGDMVRTFVCPVSEEEKDYSKIVFRKEIYDALLKGYLSQMGEAMSAEEKKSIPFAGKMMTYIMALRFLADYLNGNVYYHITYPEQNLIRAGNQLRLLEILSDVL